MNRTAVNNLLIRMEQTSKLDDATRAAVDHVCMAARLGEMTESLFQFLPAGWTTHFGVHRCGNGQPCGSDHALAAARGFCRS